MCGAQRRDCAGRRWWRSLASGLRRLLDGRLKARRPRARSGVVRCGLRVEHWIGGSGHWWGARLLPFSGWQARMLRCAVPGRVGGRPAAGVELVPGDPLGADLKMVFPPPRFSSCPPVLDAGDLLLLDLVAGGARSSGSG